MVLTFLIIRFILPIWILSYISDSEAIAVREKPYENSIYIKNQNIDWHCRFWGNAKDTTLPWVILVHGFGGSSYSWRFVAPFLEKNHYNVLTVDLPGFGYTSRNNKAIEAVHIPHALRQIALQFTSNKVIWVGHSMGAQAVATVATFDTLLTQLVLVNGVFNLSSEATKKRPYLMAIFKVLPVNTLAKLFATEKQFTKMLHSAYGQIPDSVDIKAYLHPFEDKNAGKAFIAFANNKTLTTTTSPNFNKTVIIWGDSDQWISPNIGYNFAKKHNIPIFNIRNAGHCPMETHSNEFNTILLKAIRLHAP